MNNLYLLAAPHEYHGIYIHIGEKSYFKVGVRFATLREGGWKPSLPYMPFPSLICAVHYLCSPRFTAIAWPLRKREGATFSQQTEPFRVSARGLWQPKFGQQNEDDASRDTWRHYDSWAIFAVSQMFPEKPVNIGTIGKVSPSKSQFAETMWRHSLLMPPGKKTKNTLACVFTVANVLGTCKRDNSPILI